MSSISSIYDCLEHEQNDAIEDRSGDIEHVQITKQFSKANQARKEVRSYHGSHQ